MKKAAVEIICALLVILFAYTAISKLQNFQLFRHDMLNQPFPGWTKYYLVWIVPGVEVIISLALLFNKSRRAGLYGSLLLMSAFTVYTALVLVGFFKRVPCSCGGVIRNLSWSEHLVLNLFFLVISVLGLILTKRNPIVGKQENSQILFST